MSDPDTPPEIRDDVAEYLASMDKKLSPSTFSGEVGIGVRYQTDANTLPDNNLIEVLGIVFPNSDPDLRSRSDFNAVLTGSVTHIYDFEEQNGITWETSGQLYATQQARIHELSLGVVEVDSGPRIPMPLPTSSFYKLSIHPYLIASGASLDYNPFFAAYGAGTDFHGQLGSQFTTDLSLEYRRRDFYNSRVDNQLSGYSGNLYTAHLAGVYAVTPDDAITAAADYTRNDSDADFDAYDQYSVSAAYVRLFDAPFGLTSQSWSASLRGARIWRPYDAPDLFITLLDPRSRDDRQWLLGGQLRANIDAHFGVTIDVMQDWAASNIINYRYDNTSVTTTVNYRF